MANDTPSKPNLFALDDAALDGITTERSDVRHRTVSAAEAFSKSADAIRSIRGDTGTLSLRNILPAQLAQSRFIAQFQQADRHRWIEIITELMVSAKASITTSSPVDFYQKYRKFKEDEETKSASEKLLFIERLADALNGTRFTFKIGFSATTWTVILCTSDELGGAAPSVLARSDETGETQKFQLVQVMSGLRID